MIELAFSKGKTDTLKFPSLTLARPRCPRGFKTWLVAQTLNPRTLGQGEGVNPYRVKFCCVYAKKLQEFEK